MENDLPEGAIRGYEDSEACMEDFFGVMLGEVAPVIVIEKLKGTQEAINVAHSCFCNECQEFLTEHGEELVQVPYVDGLQA